MEKEITLVPPHPSLNAISCAKSSPNPSISPLINGKTRLIAALRSRPQNVGVWYWINGEEFREDGRENSSLNGYSSSSDG